ncbi:MAG: RluA family pseudouridine synthase [Chloroflexi bacterium]|nr:RluA family pseudouridine synthase [Chloroflexota bacterium]MCI0574805.1 RluA family pseudouridine synthase [Chloroflexota bacterium]MCI0649826.1 RluA family pseudouridine synthase [Chloroflexota bacterium]MCI0729123.1 RluA family pseudouridine synthase [Chloroflexota bacterium]
MSDRLKNDQLKERRPSIVAGLRPRHLVLTLERPGERLDKALAEALPELSRAQCQRLIKEGLVTLAGRPARASYRLEGHERVAVVIPPPKETDLAPEPIPLDIRYEDEDMILVNKPAGMVVHPAAGHPQGTLVNAILAHCPDLAGVGGEKRPGIVHRLDKDTSGLLLVAKNDQAMRYLQAQFKRRTVTKIYLALVEGRFGQAEVLIDAPIGRDPHNRKKMAVIPPNNSATARPAQTRVRLLGYYGDFSLVECRPLTGRTHQIRVHLAFAGYPIAGDLVYGRRKQRLDLDRHFLHAAELTFKRPSDGRELTFKAELPRELQRLLD